MAAHIRCALNRIVMETDEKESTTSRAVTGTSGSVNVSLHPLVIMNISDHYTRARVQGEGTVTGTCVCVCVRVLCVCTCFVYVCVYIMLIASM